MKKIELKEDNDEEKASDADDKDIYSFEERWLHPHAKNTSQNKK